MLGFGAISSRSISGSPEALIASIAVAVGATSLSLSSAATWNATISAAGTSALSFTPAAVWTSLNELYAATPLTFTGDGLLRLAGRPLVFTARGDNFTFRGSR